MNEPANTSQAVGNASRPTTTVANNSNGTDTARISNNISLSIGVGVGMASYSSSHNPFTAQSNPALIDPATRQINANTNNSAQLQRQSIFMSPPQAQPQLPQCSLSSSPYHSHHHHHHHHHHHNHHSHLNQPSQITNNADFQTFTSASPSSQSSSIINSFPINLNSTSTINNNSNQRLSNPACSLLSSTSSSSTSSSSTLLNNASNNHNNNFYPQQPQLLDSHVVREVQAQAPTTTALTVTLITTIPATNNLTQSAQPLTTLTPLIPIMTAQSLVTTSNLTPIFTIPQQIQPQQQQPQQQTPQQLQPTTSSTPSASSSSSSSSAILQKLSTSNDWFTYLYKIDHIIDLIKNHEFQQGFVQSPIFSFTNHLLTSSTNTSSNNNTNTDEPKPQQQQAATSNWRLIFYPNGAGPDCKNFLSIFLKYLSDEPVKIQMMFSIVDNNNEDVYVKYTVNKFNKSNDWGFKQLIHKNAVLFQKDKFLKTTENAVNSSGTNGTLYIRVKIRLDDQKYNHIKKLSDNLHYCKLLSENFNQYYYHSENESGRLIKPVSNDVITQTTAQQQQFNHRASNLIDDLNSSQSQTNLIKTHGLISAAGLNNSYYDVLLVVRYNKKKMLLTDDETQLGCFNCEKNRSIENLCPTAVKKMKLNNLSSVNVFPDDIFSQQQQQEQINKSQKYEILDEEFREEFAELRAHKCILAARSPVFKAMFNYRLKENLSNRVVIEDCPTEVMKAFLKYVYTAYLPEDIKHIAIDLYMVAEKYLVDSLKIKCREYLTENLSIDSVIQIYILSEFFGDAMLRKQSLKFISENIDKVTQEPDWNEFMMLYPHFFTNAFIRLCKKDF